MLGNISITEEGYKSGATSLLLGSSPTDTIVINFLAW